MLTSRARAKVIILVTYSLLEHLSDNVEVLQESRLLKQFVEDFCTDVQRIRLGFVKHGVEQYRDGELRRK